MELLGQVLPLRLAPPVFLSSAGYFLILFWIYFWVYFWLSEAR
jgi:hypothetical protein